MSRLLVTNKSFELLEPYEGKLSRTVLRGESSRKGADLLDIHGLFRICVSMTMGCKYATACASVAPLALSVALPMAPPANSDMVRSSLYDNEPAIR